MRTVCLAVWVLWILGGDQFEGLFVTQIGRSFSFGRESYFLFDDICVMDESKHILSQIISSKLDRDNCPYWKRIIEVYLTD